MSTVNEAQCRSTAKSVGAVVVAAGESRRMQGIDKIFHPLDGVPLVWHSILAFQSHSSIVNVVLVTSESNFVPAEKMIETRGNQEIVSVCEGGERRQDSVLRGLKRLKECEFVVVHDGARPFITTDLVDRGIATAQEGGAAIAAVPVKDTIKASDSNGMVTRTIPRDRLWAVQTPQVFRTSLLEEAHRRVTETVTDDASMVEAIGHPVQVFLGSYFNIKVTTPEDLIIANAIIDHVERRGSSKVK